MEPRTIMVVTDASENAKRAELFAAELASHMRDTELLLAHTIPPRKLPPITPADKDVYTGLAAHVTDPGVHRAQGEALLAEAKERVEAALGGSGALVKVSTKLIENHSPAKGILEEVCCLPSCQMIVMGSRGHDGLPGMILGSVSNQVLHNAHCPVTIVKT
jgi:nucleotide-binding universal stress UspA family protein